MNDQRDVYNAGDDPAGGSADYVAIVDTAREISLRALSMISIFEEQSIPLPQIVVNADAFLIAEFRRWSPTLIDHFKWQDGDDAADGDGGDDE